MRYRRTACARWTGLFITFLLSASLSAQLRQIDTAKLPHDPRVQKAYSNVLPVEPMVHDWRAQWGFPTPKAEVAALLTSSLHDLQSAEAAAPQNEEIFLFAGLVAHFAYNVDADGTYEVAVQDLEKAGKLAPGDYRAGWFLGIHQCQSNEAKAGMERMLAVEEHTPWKDLPMDFWDDYIACSDVTLMPAHTLRALHRAVDVGGPASKYSSWVETTGKRYILTDSETNYDVRKAWRAANEKDGTRFTSELCGLEFSVPGKFKVGLSDVAKGVCTIQFETGPYPSKSGSSTPTLLVLTRGAKPQEKLGDFVQSILKARYPLARATAVPSCPADSCLSFDIVDRSMYQSEGGGHLLVAAFAEQAPDFPGLLFERPSEPPKGQAGGEVTYYHPVERLHRLPGTLYSIVLLDSNASIFERAEADFSALVRSLRLD